MQKVARNFKGARAAWQRKRKAEGPQTKALYSQFALGGLVELKVAVLVVADYRKAALRQVNSNLMRAASGKHQAH